MLTQIATDTGGELKRLPTEDLMCELQRVRAKLSGGTAAVCTQHSVLPGATVTFNVDVPAGQEQASFNTSWRADRCIDKFETLHRAISLFMKEPVI